MLCSSVQSTHMVNTSCGVLYSGDWDLVASCLQTPVKPVAKMKKVKKEVVTDKKVKNEKAKKAKNAKKAKEVVADMVVEQKVGEKKMDRKNVASRAFHKAKREAVQQGKSNEDANSAGRDASNLALLFLDA